MDFELLIVGTMVLELLTALSLNPKGYYKAWCLFHEATQGAAVNNDSK